MGSVGSTPRQAEPPESPSTMPRDTFTPSAAAGRSARLAVRVAVDPRSAVGRALGEQRVDHALALITTHVERMLPGARLASRSGLLDVVLVAEPTPAVALHELPGRVAAAVTTAGRALGAAHPLTPHVTVAPWRTSAAGAPLAHAPGAQAEPLPTASALLALASGRDPQAATHGWHVATIAHGLATTLGLGPDAAASCHLAGLVHDVGKTTVPDGILSHPGPLHGDEWAVVRQHPAAAAALLEHLPQLRAVVPAVLHHHERLDGGGYPYGLAGTDIPLAARILAVADAYSAMTATRPYRAAYAPATALRYVEAVAGAQLDADVVDALRRLVAPDASPVEPAPTDAAVVC